MHSEFYQPAILACSKGTVKLKPEIEGIAAYYCQRQDTCAAAAEIFLRI
jgi:hypothetical protein